MAEYVEVCFAPEYAPDWFPVAMRLQTLFHARSVYGRVVVANHDQRFGSQDLIVDEVAA